MAETILVSYKERNDMSKWIDIEAIRGDKLDLKFTYYQSDGETAYDLTGYKAMLTVKQFIDDETVDTNAVLQKEIESIPNPQDGIVRFNLTSAELNEFKGRYYFDHQLVFIADGNAMTPYIGTISFTRDVTRGV